ncbi:hypothetical protein MY4824_003936 [Beauveria thailandica]
MKFVIFASLIASVLAVPAELTPRTGSVCLPGPLYSLAACCATDLADIANLDCQRPTKTPSSPQHLQELCAAKGQQARCCTLIIAGQGLFCTKAI